MVTSTRHIPVAAPMLIGREREYVLECLDREELSWAGAYVERFERAFADFCGVRHAVACCNGTAALHLALLALGVGPGDRVVVPALTYVATANAVRYCGAEPLFCDVDVETWCLDPRDLARLLVRHAGERIVAVIPVHLYGVPADMAAIAAVAGPAGLAVVEDAAEAHGAMSDGAVVGGLGRLGTFSFFGNKILTCGEGGAVTTNDATLADRLRLYRGQGVDPARRYWHRIVGYNYRLTNVQAALALAQLESYQEHAARRALVMHQYEEALGRYRVQGATRGASRAHWMFAVLVPPGVDRDWVMADMALRGVETRPVFPAVTDLPPYEQVTPPVSATLARRGIVLPTHGRLTPDDVAYVVETFETAVHDV